MHRRLVLTLSSFALVFGLTACERSPEPSYTPLEGRNIAKDMALYAEWARQIDNRNQLAKLNRYLNERDVGDVVAVEELVRSDVNWRRCKAPPFLIPDEKQWPHMVSTLRLIKDEIVPRWGAVEALSVYRSPQINDCLGGASRSAHMGYYAIDMQFRAPVKRADLITRLCGLHRDIGTSRNMGLGIYKGTRFHIDTVGYRSWGQDQRGASSPCREPIGATALAAVHKSG